MSGTCSGLARSPAVVRERSCGATHSFAPAPRANGTRWSDQFGDSRVHGGGVTLTVIVAATFVWSSPPATAAAATLWRRENHQRVQVSQSRRTLVVVMSRLYCYLAYWMGVEYIRDDYLLFNSWGSQNNKNDVHYRDWNSKQKSLSVFTIYVAEREEKMKLCTGDFLRHRLNDCECMTIHNGAIIVEHETRAMYYIAMMLNQFIKATKSRMASSKVSFILSLLYSVT